MNVIDVRCYMCVLCKMIRNVKMMVIHVVGGVEMNGVKIKLVQKI